MNDSGGALFAVGDRVLVVDWMGETVEAEVVDLELRFNRPHKIPRYWLRIAGLDNRVGYRQDEMERA